MIRDGRHVLVLAPPESPVDRLLPSLRSAGFEVHRVPPGRIALELVQATAFDLVVAVTPMPGIPLRELVAVLRAGDAPCRRAGLLVAALDGTAEAEELLGHGVNRVVRGASAGRMLEAAADLLQVEPRRRVRAVVALESGAAGGPVRDVARTRDLSVTGMLLTGSSQLTVGMRVGFELLLPGDRTAIRGRAAVVRTTDLSRERVEGFGAAFEKLDDDGYERLAGFLARG
jgi:CheY-like chemotaxis protein